MIYPGYTTVWDFNPQCGILKYIRMHENYTFYCVCILDDTRIEGTCVTQCMKFNTVPFVLIYEILLRELVCINDEFGDFKITQVT